MFLLEFRRRIQLYLRRKFLPRYANSITSQRIIPYLKHVGELFLHMSKEIVNKKEINSSKIIIIALKILASKSPRKHLNGSKFTNSLFFTSSELPFKSPGTMKGWKNLLAFPRATSFPAQDVHVVEITIQKNSALLVEKAEEMYLGLVQKEREDVGGKVICPCGEELWHHSCSKEFGKGTASQKFCCNNSYTQKPNPLIILP